MRVILYPFNRNCIWPGGDATNDLAIAKIFETKNRLNSIL